MIANVTYAQFLWFAGLVASICGALLMEGTSLVPEPYHRYLLIAFVVTTAISGYKTQTLPSPWTRNSAGVPPPLGERDGKEKAHRPNGSVPPGVA